ncbi:unnamed protein product [Vicia faba]|uniref:Uncharacterized protein n=1 Tax=Vicia faba TaxID=3906 RepID=A0AAV1B7U5_VICFA|nr:unnamed protein product [Vicia faba]
MDGSRVTQSLDSLWFYTNVFTAATHEPAVPCLTSPFSSSIQESNATLCAACSPSEVEEEVMRKSAKKERRKRRKKMVAIVKQQNEMPPLEEDVAMKQLLKLWAYAVASHVERASSRHTLSYHHRWSAIARFKRFQSKVTLGIVSLDLKEAIPIITLH